MIQSHVACRSLNTNSFYCLRVDDPDPLDVLSRIHLLIEWPKQAINYVIDHKKKTTKIYINKHTQKITKHKTDL